MASPKNNAVADATVLLTGGHVDLLNDQLRGVKVVLLRVETVNKDLIESNRKVINSNEATERSNRDLIKSNRDLIAELRATRRPDRRG